MKPSKPLLILMLRRRLRNLKPHAHRNRPLIPRYAQHPKTRFILDPLIHASIAHQRIPRLLRMFLSRIWIHVRDLTSCALRLHVDVEGVGCKVGGESRGSGVIDDADGLPVVFGPGGGKESWVERCGDGGRIGALDDDIGTEALDCDVAVEDTFFFEALVQFVEGGFVGDLLSLWSAYYRWDGQGRCPTICVTYQWHDIREVDEALAA